MLSIRILMAGAIFIPVAYLHFVYAFLGLLKKKKITLILSYLLFFVFFLTDFTPYFIDHTEQLLGFKFWPIAGPAYSLFLIVWFFYVIYSTYLLLKAFRTSKGVFRLQIKYIILGMVIGFIGGSTNYLLWYRIPIPPVTNILVSVYVGSIAYAIIKHRLMDIRLIVAKSVAFIILLALIGFFYTFSMIWLEKIIFPETAGTLTPDQIIFRILLTLLVIFAFQPLKKFITKKTDRIFFKQSYDPDQLLDKLAHTMSSSIVLIELLYKVLNILVEEVKVSRGFFVILKDEKTVDTTQGVGYKKSPMVGLKEIEAISQDGLCIYDEFEEGSRIKNILKKHEASVVIPLKANDKLTGVLFLGEKSSGDMFSGQDIKIFEILGPEVAVAVENAKSYEEIQQFNAMLTTEIKKATHDLEKANQNLRELDKAKDEFITMASHQLRTPLTAIKGYLSMLLEGDAGEIKVGQYEFVQEAYYGATRMVSLINDLLNVSRMETGRFFLEVSEFDVTKTTEEEIKQLDKAVKDKGLKLVFNKSSKHLTLCADEMKVRQVIMNFIDNAIYYTLNGKITVKLYEEEEKICFEVTDNGIGVPAEQQKHLFTKFYRAENARSTRPDGTGLGLFMAKKVIEEHHGEIIFHSVEGKGSTFGFKLPKTAPVTKNSVSPFDKNIPLETPINEAKEIVSKKMKDDEKPAERERVEVK